MNGKQPNVVTIISDVAVNRSMMAQLTRDLMVLNAEFGVAVHDPKMVVPDSLLSRLGIERTEDLPVLQLVYKSGDEWPEYDLDKPAVQRDLKPDHVDMTIDGRGQVGYYLKPQGRDGPNRTELNLNRAYPKGAGANTSMITLLWG